MSKTNSFATFVLAVLSASPAATAQYVQWPVYLHDSETGDPLSGVTVSAPKLKALADPLVIWSGVSTPDGVVVLTVPQNLGSVELLASATSTHHYCVKLGQVALTQRLWMAPYSAFHKTPVIPVGATTAPITFTGVRHSPWGVLPYYFEVEVPGQVLAQPSQFWIYPREIAMASRSEFAACSPGEFHIQLRDQGGNLVVKQSVGDAGIKLRFSPFWIPGSQHTFADDIVVNSMNDSTLTWSREFDVGSWDPSTQLVTINLRTFSGKECQFWADLLGIKGYGPGPFKPYAPSTPKPPTEPPPAQPAQPKPAWENPLITKADCLQKSTPTSGFTVTCGIVTGNPEVEVNKGDTWTVSAGFEAEASAKFSLNNDGITRLLGKLSAEAGIRFELNANGSLSHTSNCKAKQSLKNNDPLAGCQCYTGAGLIFPATRRYSISGTGGVIGIDVIETVVIAVCLDFNAGCPNCEGQTGAKKLLVIPQEKLCAGTMPCN